MAASSSSVEWQRDQKDDATTSDKNTGLLRRMKCFLCQRTSFYKRILRTLIRECTFYVTIMLIRLEILDGVVTLHGEKTVNFLKLSEEHQGFYPTRDDFAKIRSPGKSFERVSDVCITRRLGRDPCQRYPLRRNAEEQEDNGKSGIVESFICRLAENLGIDTCTFEESIDHAMTSQSEVLLDMDSRKLTRSSSKTEAEIECTIINMFWQPKAQSKASKTVISSKPSSRSRSVPRDRSKNDGNGWFQAVDRGQVVPFHSKTSESVFKNPNTVRDLLCRCIHEIEESMINAFSWYIDEYFYHDFVFPRTTLSYAQYVRYQRIKKIYNPKVIVVEDNPLELGTHFAYVLALNFYSHHKYIQRYMRDLGLFCESIIRIDKDIPFVIRSLNPVTRMHIFHMIYKKSNYSRPSYKNIFKTLIMLRDAMFRLKLKDISMCKIGCCCERLDFGKILRMTEYVFLDTDINVRIGLNLMKCWHFRSRSLKHHEKSSEFADLYVERINRFMWDEVVDDTEIRSTDEE